MNHLREATRRDFLKTSGQMVAGVALAGAMARPGYAAESNTIKIALIGCGSRGTGAAENALSTEGPTKLWAMADVFPNRLENSYKTLTEKHSAQLDVPPDRRFVGMDGFKKAMDMLSKGDVVLLATPPAFRPMHVEYAVQKGLNVFMEKSFAVDGPGIRKVMKAGQEAARQNLKIAGGLMSRHSEPLEEAIRRIHDGALGDIITCWAYRVHGPVGIGDRQASMNEMAYQIANYSCFTWLNGSFIVDWLIHNIDVCCWVKNAWPVAVQGSGGREVRRDADQLFDHYLAEYTYPDGTRMMAQGRHIANCWEFFGDVIQGAKGCAVLGEGISHPRLYRGHQQKEENILWQHQGSPGNAYQREHDLFFSAIRNDKPYNETERCAKSCLTAIMGRMACESGKLITWEEALNSQIELAPGLDQFTMNSQPPVVPNAKGEYPVAVPGKSQVL
ncbi:MAG TPA: gfo/Idh/MocA family oxidoreductase [Candidatus Paceibacterota bacterium]|nr:gfo/Idh/MocA family oxidoreductase [Candidatus Paceibacterota bacterium]